MPDASEIVFDSEETSRFERDLSRVDHELASIAHEFHCKYYKTGGRGWPGRRVRRRLGLRTYEIRLILNPNYLHHQNVYYELHEQWMYEFGELLTKLLSHRELATFTSEDLRNGAPITRLITTHLAAAITSK